MKFSRTRNPSQYTTTVTVEYSDNDLLKVNLDDLDENILAHDEDNAAVILEKLEIIVRKYEQQYGVLIGKNR